MKFLTANCKTIAPNHDNGFRSRAKSEIVEIFLNMEFTELAECDTKLKPKAKLSLCYPQIELVMRDSQIPKYCCHKENTYSEQRPLRRRWKL